LIKYKPAKAPGQDSIGANSNAATPNVCAAEKAKLPGSKPERCWCLDAVFTTDVMNQVPDAAKDKACICAKCAVVVA